MLGHDSLSSSPIASTPSAAQPPAVSQPSTFTRNLIISGILAGWALTAAAPVFSSVGVQNGVEIKPPPRSEVTQQLILSTWEPKEVAIPRRFVPQGVTPADNPPPFTRVPASVLSSWDAVQDAALWSAAGYQTGIDPVPGRQSPLLVKLLLDSWTPVEPIVQGRRFVQPPAAAPADNPPIGRRDWVQGLLQSWEPPQPKAVLFSRAIAQPDEPPRRRDWPNLGIVLDSWIPPVPVEQARRFVQPVVPPGDPPPPHVRIPDALYASWNLTESGALWTAAGYQDGPTVTPDNPPVGYQPWIKILQEQEQRFALDRELWPTPKRPAVTPSGPEIVPDNPTPGRRDWLQSVVQSWEPKPPQAVWFNRLIDLSVKPIKRYDNLYVILDTWMPPPQPRQRPVVVTPSGPTPDNPPTGYQPWLALLQEQELQHVRDRELWPRPRPPVVTESGPAIVAVYREIVIRGNDPSGTEDYYEQWFG